MDPLTASALLGVGSQLSGGLFGYIGQRQANKTNLRLAAEARQHDVNMWKMQNEYNTPFMQMQRLKEAGLNPNLMYGQGTTGIASTPQKAPVPEVSNELTSLAQMSLAPVLSMYQDWRVKNAQIENLKANADATRQNATLTALRQITQDYTNKKLGIQLPYVNLQELYKTNIGRHKADQENIRSKYLYETLPEMTKQVMLRNNLLEQQTRSYQLENQFNEQLKPYGMRSTDPLWMRLIMHVLPKNILNDLSNSLTKLFAR